jgi:hypothetical protein
VSDLFLPPDRNPTSAAFKSSANPIVAGTWDNAISLPKITDGCGFPFENGSTFVDYDQEPFSINPASVLPKTFKLGKILNQLVSPAKLSDEGLEFPVTPENLKDRSYVASICMVFVVATPNYSGSLKRVVIHIGGFRFDKSEKDFEGWGITLINLDINKSIKLIEHYGNIFFNN